MIKITAHGRLGRDPELREVNDTRVASFSLASNDGKDNTTWLDCQAWGKQADLIKTYFNKGSEIVIAGSLKSRTWDNDGEKRTAFDVRVTDIDFCGSKKDKDDEVEL